MWTGATESLQAGMTNVAFLRTGIEWIDRFFTVNEVNEIWLTFSDPQMKKVSKRLTSTYFLERYRHILTDGGRVHVKTDSNFLYTYTSCMVRQNNLPVEFSTEDLYHTEFSDQTDEYMKKVLLIQTYYERQWIARGLNIRYIQFRLPHTGTLIEPDVEIELDSYRSYNRSKRSGLQISR